MFLHSNQTHYQLRDSNLIKQILDQQKNKTINMFLHSNQTHYQLRDSNLIKQRLDSSIQTSQQKNKTINTQQQSSNSFLNETRDKYNQNQYLQRQRLDSSMNPFNMLPHLNNAAKNRPVSQDIKRFQGKSVFSQSCKWNDNCNKKDCQFKHTMAFCQLNKTCDKGEFCKLRHSVAICKYNEKCNRNTCKFRHANDKSSIACRFWPKCNKPKCEYYHPNQDINMRFKVKKNYNQNKIRAQSSHQRVNKTFIKDDQKQQKIQTDIMLCIICVEKEKSVRLNCGHAQLCESCSQNVTKCPTCRLPIRSKDKIYL